MGEDGEETEEPTCAAVDIAELNERSRIFPVCKSDRCTVFTTARGDVDRYENQAKDGDYFDTGEPKLGFSIHSSTEHIETQCDNRTDSDPYCRINLTRRHPIRN